MKPDLFSGKQMVLQIQIIDFDRDNWPAEKNIAKSATDRGTTKGRLRIQNSVLNNETKNYY